MEEHVLFRSLKGRTAPAEEAAVRTWRADSHDSEQSYQQLAAVLKATAATEGQIETEPPSITDDRIAEQTITTWFADQPVEQVLRIFCLVAEARCTTANGVTTVGPKFASRTPGIRR